VTLLASLLWSSINGLRRLLWRGGLLKSVRLSVPVVSVGNFEAGGTGKTPIVIALARRALTRGQIPLVLSRGHGGSWSKRGGVIRPQAALVDSRLCGDEVSLIQQQVPGAWIGVGADRVLAFERAMKEASDSHLPKPSWAILDDGFQHLRIFRDVEILVLTSARPWRRVFRELPWIFDRARSRGQALFRVWSKGEEIPLGWEALDSESRHYRMKYRIRSPESRERDLKLWVISGIGAPDYFAKGLEESGWRVTRRSDFEDHARFTQSWVSDVLLKCRSEGLTPAITGKDWVKWRELGVQPSQVLVFEPAVEFSPSFFEETVLDQGFENRQRTENS
jgi:tetraacyldisaccharide 4'-kinase